MTAARAHIHRPGPPDLIVDAAALVIEDNGSLTVLDDQDQPVVTVDTWTRATLTPHPTEAVTPDETPLHRA